MDGDPEAGAALDAAILAATPEELEAPEGQPRRQPKDPIEDVLEETRAAIREAPVPRSPSPTRRDRVADEMLDEGELEGYRRDYLRSLGFAEADAFDPDPF